MPYLAAMMRPLAALLLCILATGCATMVNGRYQTLDVGSFPSGAAIEVECGDQRSRHAVTPARVRVRRAAEYCQLTFTHVGYEPKVIELTHQESRATALNAAFGLPSAIVLGIAGAIVGSAIDDAETGAEIGLEAGFALGNGGATGMDKKWGGWKWVPGDIFVILARPGAEDGEEPEEPE